MKKIQLLFIVVCFVTGVWTPEGSSQATNGGNPKAGALVLGAGTRIEAELSKPVDTRKAKAGDQITAKLHADVKQDGQMVLRRNSMLVGHITVAQAKANGNPVSSLGILFDRVEIKGGQRLELRAVILAIAPPRPVSEDPSTAGMGATPLGATNRSEADDTAEGRAQNSGAMANATRDAIVGAGAQPSGGPSSTRTPGTAGRGVTGIPGLQISDQLSNNTNGTVLISNRKDIHLDSGTQLVLRVLGQ